MFCLVCDISENQPVLPPVDKFVKLGYLLPSIKLVWKCEAKECVSAVMILAWKVCDVFWFGVKKKTIFRDIYFSS
jgi:hypothetical protein